MATVTHSFIAANRHWQVGDSVADNDPVVAANPSKFNQPKKPKPTKRASKKAD